MAPPTRTTITSGGFTVTEAEPGEGFGMAEHDWDRLYRHVSRIKQPPRWPENLMWSAIAIAAGAAFSFLAWLQGVGSLPPASQAAVSWQGWLFGATAVASLLIAAICAAFMKGSADQLIRDKDDVLEDMKELHVPRSLMQADTTDPDR